MADEYEIVDQAFIDNYLQNPKTSTLILPWDYKKIIFYKEGDNGEKVEQPSPWEHMTTEDSLIDVDQMGTKKKILGSKLYIKTKDRVALENYKYEYNIERQKKLDERTALRDAEEQEKQELQNHPNIKHFNELNTRIYNNLKSHFKTILGWGEDNTFVVYLNTIHNLIKSVITLKTNNIDIKMRYIRNIANYLSNCKNYSNSNNDNCTPMITSNMRMSQNIKPGSTKFEDDNIIIQPSDQTVKIITHNVIFVFEMTNTDLLFFIKKMIPSETYKYSLSNEPIDIIIDSIKGSYDNGQTLTKYFFICKTENDIRLPESDVLKPYVQSFVQPQINQTPNILDIQYTDDIVFNTYSSTYNSKEYYYLKKYIVAILKNKIKSIGYLDRLNILPNFYTQKVIYEHNNGFRPEYIFTDDVEKVDLTNYDTSIISDSICILTKDKQRLLDFLNDFPQKTCIGSLCKKLGDITRRNPQIHPGGNKKTRKQMYSARSRRIITLRKKGAKGRRKIERSRTFRNKR
jgi:hypothetical protein